MMPPPCSLPHRAVISLTGPDTLTLLERLVTHDTQNWAPGETRYGGLLTPQGKVLADWLALRTPEGVVLDTDKAHAEALLKRLKLFRLRSQVEIRLCEELAILAAASDTELEAVHRFTDVRTPDGSIRYAVSTEQAETDDAQLAAYHLSRIQKGLPEQGFDFASGEVFPADINMDLLGGVALKKGCFVGQEVVSRMHRRGTIRKRTVAVTLPQGVDYAPGQELRAPQPIGQLTSLSGQHALARIRVDRLAKALQAQQEIQCQEQPVELHFSDWLQTELQAYSET